MGSTWRPLQVGCSGQDVYELQKTLRDVHGYASVGTDGIFGPATYAAVCSFQAKKGLEADGVVGRNTRNALGYPTTGGVQPKWLIIHTTATPAGSPHHTAESIAAYHTKMWGRPGYSRIVEYDGKIVETWPVDLTDGFQPYEITYGAAEYNPYSVHVCYIGGDGYGSVPARDTRTQEQKASLLKIVKEVVGLCPDIQVGGHNQFHAKACPCFSVPKWLEQNGIEEKNIFRKDPFGLAAKLSA